MTKMSKVECDPWNSDLEGVPRMEKLEIEGRGFHTNLYVVRGIYSRGKEGKSRIQWLKSMVGSPDLISIPGETGMMYEANIDDVGYRLVAIYTPIRDNGVEGQPVSASTDPIAVEPDVLKEVKQKLDLGSVKFEGLCDKDRSPKRGLELGKEVTIPEVYHKLNYDEKTSKWTNSKAEIFYGTYEKLKKSKISQGETALDESALFYEANRRKNKRGKSCGFWG